MRTRGAAPASSASDGQDPSMEGDEPYDESSSIAHVGTPISELDHFPSSSSPAAHSPAVPLKRASSSSTNEHVTRSKRKKEPVELGEKLLAEGSDEDDAIDGLMQLHSTKPYIPGQCCPFCTRAWPKKPSSELLRRQKVLLNLKNCVKLPPGSLNAYRLPMIHHASFCRLHYSEAVTIPAGLARGWPSAHDWLVYEKLLKSSDTYAPLASIITSPDGESSPFLEAFKKRLDEGAMRVTQDDMTDFDLGHPGYFGLEGLTRFLPIVSETALTNPVLRDAISDDPLLSTLSPQQQPLLCRTVLLPEACLLLIVRREGGAMSRSEALELYFDSRDFGAAMFPGAEDQQKDFRDSDEETEEEAEAEKAERAASEMKKAKGKGKAVSHAEPPSSSQQPETASTSTSSKKAKKPPASTSTKARKAERAKAVEEEREEEEARAKAEKARIKAEKAEAVLLTKSINVLFFYIPVPEPNAKKPPPPVPHPVPATVNITVSLEDIQELVRKRWPVQQEGQIDWQSLAYKATPPSTAPTLSLTSPEAMAMLSKRLRELAPKPNNPTLHLFINQPGAPKAAVFPWQDENADSAGIAAGPSMPWLDKGSSTASSSTPSTRPASLSAETAAAMAELDKTYPPGNCSQCGSAAQCYTSPASLHFDLSHATRKTAWAVKIVKGEATVTTPPSSTWFDARNATKRAQAAPLHPSPYPHANFAQQGYPAPLYSNPAHPATTLPFFPPPAFGYHPYTYGYGLSPQQPPDPRQVFGHQHEQPGPPRAPPRSPSPPRRIRSPVNTAPHLSLAAFCTKYKLEGIAQGLDAKGFEPGVTTWEDLEALSGEEWDQVLQGKTLLRGKLKRAIDEYCADRKEEAGK